MAIKINEDFMELEINGAVKATAGWLVDGKLLAQVLRPEPGDHCSHCHRTAGDRTQK
jgi:hypothetical protein